MILLHSFLQVFNKKFIFIFIMVSKFDKKIFFFSTNQLSECMKYFLHNFIFVLGLSSIVNFDRISNRNWIKMKSCDECVISWNRCLLSHPWILSITVDNYRNIGKGKIEKKICRTIVTIYYYLRVTEIRFDCEKYFQRFSDAWHLCVSFIIF